MRKSGDGAGWRARLTGYGRSPPLSRGLERPKQTAEIHIPARGPCFRAGQTARILDLAAPLPCPPPGNPPLTTTDGSACPVPGKRGKLERTAGFRCATRSKRAPREDSSAEAL